MGLAQEPGHAASLHHLVVLEKQRQHGVALDLCQHACGQHHHEVWLCVARHARGERASHHHWRPLGQDEEYIVLKDPSNAALKIYHAPDSVLSAVPGGADDEIKLASSSSSAWA